MLRALQGTYSIVTVFYTGIVKAFFKGQTFIGTVHFYATVTNYSTANACHF